MIQSSQPLFDEIAIVDLTYYQIAVLTATQIFNNCKLSTQTSVFKRYYQNQGWLIYKNQIISHFDQLKIDTIFPENSSFKPIQRLAPSIPISFEIRSSQPLPNHLLCQAFLICELPKTDFPHHAVFYRVLPRFVKVYPFKEYDSLLEKVSQMLAAKDLFISQNFKQLKRIPFYQQNFGL
ncbi:MAG: hypothetical protein AAGE59_31865 [Cyanobacteria bacterium P01_F01_bin.86]